MSNVPCPMYLSDYPPTKSPDFFPPSCNATSATTYENNPTSSVTVTPQNTATTSARTEEITENAPLIPHYHAVGALPSTYRARLTPSGNAMPMKKPDGNKSRAETTIRRGVDAAIRCPVTKGLSRMNPPSRI